ncbi:MAG: hypothetical protein WBJ07_07945, partial [Limnochordia bacterium]
MTGVTGDGDLSHAHSALFFLFMHGGRGCDKSPSPVITSSHVTGHRPLSPPVTLGGLWMRILIAGAGKLGYKLAEAFSNQENSIT